VCSSLKTFIVSGLQYTMIVDCLTNIEGLQHSLYYSLPVLLLSLFEQVICCCSQQQ
jgi:hypothetical protein